MEDRSIRLVQINDVLKERGLRPLTNIGDHEKGEIEITGVADWLEHNKRFYTDVVFDVLFPGGKAGKFPVRFNANSVKSDGAVFVPVVNGKFAIVKQFRVTDGRYTYELPRGFSEKFDQARVQGSLGTFKIADLPLGTLLRELGEEIVGGGQVVSITHLGNIAENTGTHNVIPSFFLVILRVDEVKLDDRLRDPEIKSVELWETAKVSSEIGGRLCDNHSLTALFLAAKHIEGLPRL